MNHVTKKTFRPRAWIAVALLLHSFGASAELTRDQETDIAVRSLIADPQASRVSYLMARRIQLEQYTTKNPNYRAYPQIKQNYIRDQLQKEEQAVDGSSFKGGLVQEGLRELADKGKYAAALALRSPRLAVIPRAATDKVADSFLDAFTAKPVDPKVKLEHQMILMKATIEAARDPSSPHHDYAKTLLKRVHVNAEVPLEYEPRVAGNLHDARQAEELKRIKDMVRKLAGKKNPSDQEKRELTNASDRLLELAAENAKNGIQDAAGSVKTSDSKVTDNDLELARKWTGRLSEASMGLSAAAQAAAAFGDEKTAHRLMMASDACSKINDVISTTLTKSFTENPAMYANVYLAAALVIKNLISAQQEQNAMQAIMAQLQKIAEAIENLRKEMHQRFDILDSKMSDYFDRSFVELISTRSAVSRLNQLVATAIKDFEVQQFEIQTGLRFLWRTQMTDWKSRCFPPLKKIDAGLAQQCRNQFALLALGDWNTSPGGGGPVGSSTQQISQITQNEYLKLRDLIQQVSPGSNELSTIHPANWYEGAVLFANLFKSQTQHRNLAKSPGAGFTQQDGLRLEQVIQAGVQVKNTLDNLILEKSQNGYELRSEVVSGLLKRYRDESLAAITEGSELIKEKAGRGPNPYVGLDQAIVVDQGMEMFKRPLWFCPGVKEEITHGTIVPSRNTLAGPIKTTELSIQVLKQYFFPTLVGRDTFKWNAQFLHLIPASAVWAARMGTDKLQGFEKFELSGCFRKIHLPRFVDDAAGMAVDFEFELDFMATFGEGQNRRTVRVGQATLKETKFHKGYDLMIRGKKHVPFVINLWNGQTCEPCTFSWSPGIHENPAKRFQRNLNVQPDPEYINFVGALNRSLGRAKDQIKYELDSRYSRSGQTTAKDLILMTLNLGIYPKSPGVDGFVSFVNFEDSLPKPLVWAQAAAYGSTSPQVLEQKLEQRIGAVEARLQELSKSGSLKPRGNGIDKILEDLRKLTR